MQFAVGLPNVGEYGDPRLLLELGSLAERSGWDGVFVWDHVAYREPGWAVADPQIVVAALAAVTERIRIGMAAVAVPRRRPSKLARELASLDVLSQGRAAFAAGLGSQPAEEYESFGEDGDASVRAERLDEALAILAGMWSGERFGFRGEHYTVAEAVFKPKPLQTPRIPVWIAGRWPAKRPFRRAARWDGVFPTHADVGHRETMTEEQLEEIVEFTMSHRDRASGDFDVIIEGQTGGADPRKDARLVSRYEDVGLTWWIEKIGWFRGSREEMQQRIEAGPPQA